MKIDFRVQVKDLIHTIGSVDYLTLVAVGKEHGLTALEVYGQLHEGLANGSIGEYRPFGKAVVYQDPEVRRKERVKVTEKELVDVERFIQRYEKKFRAGDVLKDLIKNETVRWVGSGEDSVEVQWDKDHVAAALRELKKLGKIECGPSSKQGLWYWLHGWKPRKGKDE